MRGFGIGLVLGVVLLGAVFLTPSLTLSSSARDARAAFEQVELARRQLHGFDPWPTRFASRASLVDLQKADLGEILANSQDALDDLGADFSEEIQSIKRRDRDHGLTETTITEVSTNPSGVQSALAGFESYLTENDDLLNRALDDAAAAGRTASIMGVPEILGMARLVEANARLAEARRIRTELGSLQTDALSIAHDWAVYRAETDHYAGLDVTDILASLTSDLEEMQTLLAASSDNANELARQVSDLDKQLEGLAGELRDGRTQLLTMQGLGFTAGDDASFDEYREKYRALSARLRELQEREHLLRYGGIRGGRFANDDLLAGAIEGGERVTGVAELRRRLHVANDQAERYTVGLRAIEMQMEIVRTFGTTADTQESAYASMLQSARREFDSIVERLATIAEQAFQKEDEALQAARAAVDAFAGAGQAVGQWKRNIRQVQTERDSQRQNKRLKRILEDPIPEQAATTAEAEAQSLIARIYVERSIGVRGYKIALERLTNIIPGSTFDAEPLETAIQTARTEGEKALGAARTAYTELAKSAQATAWIYNAALATVEYQSIGIDPDRRSQYLDAARQAIENAVSQAGQSPFASTYVALRDALADAE